MTADFAAYSCGGSRGFPCPITGTAFPIDPFREPPATSVAPHKKGVNTRGAAWMLARWPWNALLLRSCHIPLARGGDGRMISQQRIVQKVGCGSQFNMVAALNRREECPGAIEHDKQSDHPD